MCMHANNNYSYGGAYVSMVNWILLDRVRIAPLKRSY